MRPALATVLCVILAACGSANVKPPQAPDDAVLAEAEAMLVKAREAGANELAPEALRSARRRLTVARDILYDSTGRGRDLSKAEQQRVRQLGDAAYLDARLALVRTQVTAIRRKNEEFAAELEKSAGVTSGESQ